MPWNGVSDIPSLQYTCGFCNSIVATGKGFYRSDAWERGTVRICPHCDKPSYFAPAIQIPGALVGEAVKSLPTDIEQLYQEARQSASVGAHTAAVLTCRKLLMNLAVSQGATPGLRFIEYVDHLAKSGYVPPNGRAWVDHIRTRGNEATHEIHVMSSQDSHDLISFSEMLLKFVFEFPNRVPAPRP